MGTADSGARVPAWVEERSAEDIWYEFEQLRSQLPTALIEVALPGLRVTYLNATAQALLGLDESDVENGFNASRLVTPESAQRLVAIAAEQMANTVAKGLPYERQRGQKVYEIGCVRKDGSTFPAEAQGAYVLDRDGVPVGIRFIFWDLTERLARAAERQQFERQVRQFQKLESLGQLAGGIAHDFNNLLTALLGNLHLLRGEVADRPSAIDLIDDATLAAEKGAGLVRRMLDFARPEVDRRSYVDLWDLMQETAALARPLLMSEVTLELAHDGGSHIVFGNRTALQQVVLNLVVNARDAMGGAGRAVLRLSSEELGGSHAWAPSELPRGRYHVLCVCDSGPGIPAEVRERIFDPFFTTKGPGNGTGLGLSIALTVARSHDGWLAVDSPPGEGAAFRLYLPDAHGVASAAA